MAEPRLHIRLAPHDIALLRACLLDGAEAVRAFHEWRALFDFEGQYDGGQFRLLPLLHENMARLGVTDPVMARLKGVHRFAWCETQRRRFYAIHALKALRGAGLLPMFTKGMALADGYYDPPSVRPMEDMDILVRPTEVETALDALAGAGWTPADPMFDQPFCPRSIYMLNRHALTLEHRTGGHIDLHWFPVYNMFQDQVTQTFFRRADPLIVADQEALRPHPSDLLFHVIVHGMRPNVLSPLRWVADATMILRKSRDRIVWDDVRAMAKLTRRSARLESGLRILNDVIGLEVPMPVKPSRRSLPEWLEERADDLMLVGKSPEQLWRYNLATHLLWILKGSHRWSLPEILWYRQLRRRAMARQKNS